MEAHTQLKSPAPRRIGAMIATFFGGVALGYATASLLTPKTGREIRSSISDYAKNTTDTVSTAVRGVVNSAKEATRSVGRRMAGKEKGHEGAEAPKAEEVA